MGGTYGTKYFEIRSRPGVDFLESGVPDELEVGEQSVSEAGERTVKEAGGQEDYHHWMGPGQEDYHHRG